MKFDSMKLALLIPILILLSAFIIDHSIEEKEKEWNKIYGIIGVAYDILKIENGYLVTGRCQPEEKEYFDAFLLKIDKNGNEIWNRTYGGWGEEVGKKIIETVDGYIICGYTLSYGNGESDFWVVKVDKNGNEIWNRTYGGSRTDFGMDIIKTNDNGYMIVGETESFDLEGDAWVVKLDENGNEIWNKAYGSRGKWDYASSVLETDDGYLISGLTSSYGSKEWDIWLLKIDKEGNEIWNKTYGFWDMEWSYDLLQLKDGYLIMGVTTSTPTGWNDIWLIKVDENGNEIWNKTYGGMGVESGFDIKETKDGFIIAGTTDSYNFNIGIFDIWLLKIDKEGNEIWNKTYGGRDHDWGYGVIYEGNSYIVTGAISKIIPQDNNVRIEPHVWVAKCSDSPPINVMIERPKKGYLYIFDKEILPFRKTLAIGGITIRAVASNASLINRVEFYVYEKTYEYIPRAVIYEPPYEWEWKERTICIRHPAYVIVAAYYGNAGAVAVDKRGVYIINLIPVPSSTSASLHEGKI